MSTEACSDIPGRGFSRAGHCSCDQTCRQVGGNCGVRQASRSVQRQVRSTATCLRCNGALCRASNCLGSLGALQSKGCW